MLSNRLLRSWLALLLIGVLAPLALWLASYAPQQQPTRAQAGAVPAAPPAPAPLLEIELSTPLVREKLAPPKPVTLAPAGTEAKAEPPSTVPTVFHCRLVDAASGLPVVGALMEQAPAEQTNIFSSGDDATPSSLVSATSDANGYVSTDALGFECCSMRIRAVGYGPIYANLKANADGRVSAPVIRLAKAARLSITLLDRNAAPMVNAPVSVSVAG